MLLVCFLPSTFPASPIFYIHFPVFKRYTLGCLTYELGRAVMSVVTSFGLVYLIDRFGYWGMLIVTIPVLLGYKFGLSHFEKLEKEAGNYPEKKTFLEDKEVEERIFAYN